MFERDLEKIMRTQSKEATFALNEQSSLKLYDCLIPNLTTSKMYKYLLKNDRKIKDKLDVSQNDEIEILKEELA